MDTKESQLNSLLERIGYERGSSPSKDHILVRYYSRAINAPNLCNIGTINEVLEIHNKRGDDAVKQHIVEKTVELDKQIKSNVKDALTLSDTP